MLLNLHAAACPFPSLQLEIKDMLGKMEAAMETDFETVARNLGVELKKDGADNLVTDAEGNYVVARKGPPPPDKSPAISKLKLLPVGRCCRVRSSITRGCSPALSICVACVLSCAGMCGTVVLTLLLVGTGEPQEAHVTHVRASTV